MSILDNLASRNERELMPAFLALCDSTAATQEQVLLDILRRSEDTEIGRILDFGNIRTVDEYREKVPVNDWNFHAPFSEKMQHGEKDILFPGTPMHFLSTSGTTGPEKMIPESATGNTVRAITSALRNTVIAGMAPEVLQGHFLPLVSRPVHGKTSAGIPFCKASGMTVMGLPDTVRRLMAYPPGILQAPDAASIDYLLMRFSMAHDVQVMIGNNPIKMANLFELADNRKNELLNDIENGTISREIDVPDSLRSALATELPDPDPNRAGKLAQAASQNGKLLPEHYWSGLRVLSCWLSGSVGSHLDAARAWLNDRVQYIDYGYGASEGKYNIPMRPATSAAPLSVFGYFFEFVPVNGGAPVLAHEVHDNEVYRMVVTSYSGLYRYDMHDLVRTGGFTGTNPCVAFESKTGDFANICGEKIPAGQFVDVISSVARDSGLLFRHFCVVVDQKERCYHFCVEPEDTTSPDRTILERIEKLLQSTVGIYRRYRAQNLIDPPSLVVMKTGWQNELMLKADSTGSFSQVKLPVICKDPPCDNMILARISQGTPT